MRYFFRDTAHGFLAWAFGTVLSAAVLGSAATVGASAGLGQAAGQGASQSAGPMDYFVETLFRYEAIKTLTHIRVAGRKPHPYPRR